MYNQIHARDCGTTFLLVEAIRRTLGPLGRTPQGTAEYNTRCDRYTRAPPFYGRDFVKPRLGFFLLGSFRVVLVNAPPAQRLLGSRAGSCCAILTVLGETELGPAGEQPNKG